MDRSLVSLLVIEGEAKDRQHLDQLLAEHGLGEYARQVGYYETMVAVVTLYKAGRQFRKIVDGVNTDETSRWYFCAFLGFLGGYLPRTKESSVVKALILHNMGSACATINGNEPTHQHMANQAAHTMLLDINLSSNGALWRNDRDWRAVYAKVGAGVFESGSTHFDEGRYRALVDMMEEDLNKDAAGRRLFLARWLASQGRVPEAIVALEPVELTEYISAPNQINEARRYLLELRLQLDIAG